MRSTDYDRTLMTAECVAAGLFPLSINKDNFMSQWPLGTWQPVPIHSVAEKSDMVNVTESSHLTVSVFYCS